MLELSSVSTNQVAWKWEWHRTIKCSIVYIPGWFLVPSISDFVQQSITCVYKLKLKLRHDILGRICQTLTTNLFRTFIGALYTKVVLSCWAASAVSRARFNLFKILQYNYIIMASTVTKEYERSGCSRWSIWDRREYQARMTAAKPNNWQHSSTHHSARQHFCATNMYTWLYHIIKCIPNIPSGRCSCMNATNKSTQWLRGGNPNSL